jgi:hypothetical protein
MRHLKNLILAPLIVLIAVPSLAQTSDSPAPDGRFTLEFEAGPVWQTVNDIQIPNTDQGTRFSLVDLVGKGPDSAWRGYLTWRISQKSDLRLLYAPLSLTETGTPEGDILFNGSTFAGGEEISATYKFNSYRLTYSYLLHDGPSWMWRLGFTAKIRDAKVQLVQGSLDSTKDDLGFVPLLHLSSRYDFARNWYLSFDVDALAAGRDAPWIWLSSWVADWATGCTPNWVTGRWKAALTWKKFTASPGYTMPWRGFV